MVEAVKVSELVKDVPSLKIIEGKEYESHQVIDVDFVQGKSI